MKIIIAICIFLVFFLGLELIYESRTLYTFVVSLTEDKTTDLEKVLTIWDWMDSHITYDESSRGYLWRINIFRPSAFETFKSGRGKCGDISRLFIVLTHYLRYTSRRVYLKNEAGRFHVAAEVFINGKWVFFNPPNKPLQEYSYYSLYNGELASARELVLNPQIVAKKDGRQTADLFRNINYINLEKFPLLKPCLSLIMYILPKKAGSPYIPFMFEMPTLIWIIILGFILVMLAIFRIVLLKKTKANL
ncbi:MAG: transglutaminase domain-containing protein [Candidatus Omnitrophica bacterium]|nr:transglutaminase domain-containing protein [Candidatus Omnitrophota bacterium]